MTGKAYVVDELISAKAIAARVEGLAREISAHYADTDKLVVVGLLRGSFIFIADLVRELDLPVEVDFMEASSYGNSTESSREVRILKDLRARSKAAMCWWSKTLSIPATHCGTCSTSWAPVTPAVLKSAPCSTSLRAAKPM